MSELNREQIIKALECCTNGSCGVDCPYYEADICMHKAVRDALSLIKELTEENERLRERVSNQREELQRCNNLTQNLTQSRETWKKQAEKVGKQLFEALSDKKQIKAVTVRKMQERLEELYTDKLITDDMTVSIGVIKQNIKDTAKEMLEEGK